MSYISASITKPLPENISATANSEGVHLSFYGGDAGLEGCVTVFLTDEGARTLLAQLTASVQERAS